jgi:hypothetical protein
MIKVVGHGPGIAYSLEGGAIALAYMTPIQMGRIY